MRKTINKVTKKILASIMATAMILGSLTGAGISGTEIVKAKDYGISNPKINADGSVTWDKIKFGNYKQSAEFEAEPIKWRILSVDEDNNALLLADRGLGKIPYNEKGVERVDEYGDSYTDFSCTWETSTLRTWLNNDFYNDAFIKEEQAEIKQVTVKNDDNLTYSTEGGNDTLDKVYLLSSEDVVNKAYGFEKYVGDEPEFYGGSNTRYCKVSDYAYMNGAYRNRRSDYDGNGNCCWWLRSIGRDSSHATFVDDGGFVLNNGFVFNGGTIADERCYWTVRPSIQINLSSSFVQDAGEVESDGSVTDLKDGYSNPRKTDEKTVWDCVYFGRYKQTGVFEKEPIEWRVLSVNGEEALLLADKGMDCKPYNEKSEDVTWETCTLRTWLNNEFYNEAFNETEQKAIKDSLLNNKDIIQQGTNGGNDTTDKVFLLSCEDVCNSSYGFARVLNDENDTRKCKPTDYSYMNGVGLYSIEGSRCEENCRWWLRHPYKERDGVSSVWITGEAGGYCRINNDETAIRPALYINLSSSAWEVASTVSTAGGSIEPVQPTATPTANPTNESDFINKPTSTIVPVISYIPVQNFDSDESKDTDKKTLLRNLKVSSIKCVKNKTIVSGKISVSGATVKIKVGGKTYKKATVKGKKFILKVAKLKKKTKVIVKVTKRGYRSFSKVYRVK